MKRTQDEINLQIEGLKKDKEKVPEQSMFGDKNWEKIDAMISVLEGKKKTNDYYEDESAEEFEEGDNDIFFDAERAEQWLQGHEKADLFDAEN
jgi:hypothetical protein